MNEEMEQTTVLEENSTVTMEQIQKPLETINTETAREIQDAF